MTFFIMLLPEFSNTNINPTKDSNRNKTMVQQSCLLYFKGFISSTLQLRL